MSLSLVCIKQINKQKKFIFILSNSICEFVYVVYPQKNKRIKYLILITLICEFVCGFCGHKHTKKIKINTQTGL